MIYVALLRGVNVGGNNIIDMKTLKKTFERVGMKSVKTYINSGNVIFEDSIHDKKEIVLILEKAIYIDFSLTIKVLIRSIREMHTVMKTLPADWRNDSEMKSDVLFLWDEVDNEVSLSKILIRSDVDTVLYVPGAILWMVIKENRNKSGLMKLAGNQIYKKMTIRNVNSARKIYSMMQELSDEKTV